MRINWRIRFKNPVFIVQVLAAILLPILAYFEFNWDDMTTWGTIASLLWAAVQNPVVVVAVIVSVWNATTDPTTSGVSDSDRALQYRKPN